MKQVSTTHDPDVRLGDTHFLIPGYDEVHAFSADAIASDQRFPEMVNAINKKLLTEASDAAKEVIAGI